jgi:hypothetical protein
MTKVFIGGSRAVSRLNDIIRAQLDDLIRKRCAILIGDANGADKAVQQHFADRNYHDVVVICMAKCRNNVGGWDVRSIASANGKRDFAYYSQKDKVMAHEAQCGIMLWDGESRGTLANIENLLREGKKVLVYFSPTKIFHKLCTEEELQLMLSRGSKHRGETPRRLPERREPVRSHQLVLPHNLTGTRG